MPFNQGTSGHAWEGAKDTYNKLTGKDADEIEVPMPKGFEKEEKDNP